MSDSPVDIAGPESPFRQLPRLTPARVLGSQVLFNGFAIGWLLFAYHLSDRGVPPPLRVSGNPVELGYGVAAAVGIFITNALMANLIRLFPFGRSIIDWYQRRNATMFGLLPVWCLLTVAVIAGIAEEVLFRGLIQPQLGWVITGLMFALVHFPSSRYRYNHPVTWGMLGLYLPISFALGYLYEWRQDLTAPMVAHVVLDVVGLLIIKARAEKANQATTSMTSPEEAMAP
ncbi:MAG: type II CAAX endopeptidase family protein [bacterium]